MCRACAAGQIVESSYRELPGPSPALAEGTPELLPDEEEEYQEPDQG